MKTKINKMKKITKLMGWMTVMLASGTALAQGTGIYTCVDEKGRKITSDRAIPECTDRTQREMTPSGTVKRVIGPTLTAHERAAQEAKDKLAAEARAQQQEEKRRDRALVLRYPNKSSHDQERNLALAQVDEVSRVAVKSLQELEEQRKLLDNELEFYKKDYSKAPAPLKRRLEENENNVATQKRFIADQLKERQRVNQRFDNEFGKLRQLWPLTVAPNAPN